MKSSSGMTNKEASPGVSVRFDAAVLQCIRRHARTSMDAEICGVLLGTMVDGCVFVDACIEGEKAAQGAAHVTFTQNTWEHIFAIKDRDYAQKKIVGWYHSHPGFGVFLSHHDTFIHENFFSAPHQLAWVFDPHSDEEGCFGWAEGKIRRLRRFEIATKVPDAPPQPEPDVAAIREHAIPTASREQPAQKGLRAAWERIPIRKRFTLLLIGLAILLAVIAVQISLLFGKADSFKIPTVKPFIERIRHTIRPPASPRVGAAVGPAKRTEISSVATPVATFTTNSVYDSRVQDTQPDATKTHTNAALIPKPDLPGQAADPPPASASPEPN